jgi:predicted transcriptional regulator
MKQLTKVQVEAIVDEVRERLGSLTTDTNLPPKAEKEWKSLNERFEKLRDTEKEIEELSEKYDAAKEKGEELEDEIREMVVKFEKKFGVGVEWRYIDYDEGEVPSVTFPTDNLSDKIRRQIAILSIDKKNGPVTADDLIETIINKFS